MKSNKEIIYKNGDYFKYKSSIMPISYDVMFCEYVEGYGQNLTMLVLTLTIYWKWFVNCRNALG